MNKQSQIIGVIGGIVSIGAGIYLLIHNTQAQSDVFDVLIHGIGAYFVGKGLWMISQATSRSGQIEIARKQLEFAAHEHTFPHRSHADSFRDTD